MLKKAPLFFLPFIFSCSNNRQLSDADYFSGQLEYKYSYQSDSLNTDSLARVKPQKGQFRFDSINYQSRFFQKDTFTYYYSGMLNKAVSKTNNKMDEGCEDYGLSTDSIISFRIHDTDEKVLGYSCRILEFESKIFHTKYWVSKNLKIAPATYKKHEAYNWSFYGEQSEGGLILKLEHRFKQFSMTGMATSVKREDQNFKALEIDESLIENLCNKE